MDFNRNNGPNVIANLLPNHIGPNVNAIMEGSGLKANTKVDKGKSSMEEVYKVLVKIRVIPKRIVFTKEKEERDCYCRYHATCIGHTIQQCEDFRKILQAMIDQEEIEFFEKTLEEYVNVITNAKFMGGLLPRDQSL